MVYVFEDHKNSLLSQLFEKSYPPEIIKNFHYTGGNGKIKTYIETTFSKQEKIIVWLDTMPGNKNLRGVYYKLASMLKQYPNLRILPVMSREYYLIKCLEHTPCVLNKNWVEVCLSFGRPDETIPPILETEKEKAFCINSEKFSKIVARKALAQCVCTGWIDEHEDRYRPYYKEDCLCSTSLVSAACAPISLLDKSRNFLKTIRILPKGHSLPGTLIVEWKDVSVLHRTLVDSYNALCDRIVKEGKDWGDSYEELIYIH